MKIDSLFIGELESYKLIEITDSITSLSMDLTSNMVSELQFSVEDHNFNMFNSRYFIAGRRVTFNNEEYEIARVDLQLRNDSKAITVRARSRATERMRFTKGTKSFGNISPSVFAANMAAEYGLKIFAEDSPANGEIKQQSNDNKNESIWDVLTRLAADLDFLLFEARGTLFFASQKFIVDNNTNPVLDVYSLPAQFWDDATFYATSLSFSISEDASKPYSGNASLLPSPAAESMYPGCVIRLPALPHYKDIKFFVERVSVEAGPEKLVKITFSSNDTLEERMCITQQFAKGSSGDCVKRIQTAVKTIVDGKFGPVTERAVKEYQARYGLPATGVVDAATWAVIENPPTTQRPGFPFPITDGPIPPPRGDGVTPLPEIIDDVTIFGGGRRGFDPNSTIPPPPTT